MFRCSRETHNAKERQGERRVPIAAGDHDEPHRVLRAVGPIDRQDLRVRLVYTGRQGSRLRPEILIEQKALSTVDALAEQVTQRRGAAAMFGMEETAVGRQEVAELHLVGPGVLYQPAI